MAQHQCTCKTYIVLYWQVQEKYWVVLYARLQPYTQLLTQNIFLTNIRSIGMAGQVARPRLVAHQGVRRSAPSHPAPPCQTPHYPEAPTGLWPPLHQCYLVHLTPVQTIHTNSYKVIHHHYIMRQWSDQQCSPTWFHQRGRSPSLHLKTDHAWGYHSLVSHETRLVLL